MAPNGTFSSNLSIKMAERITSEPTVSETGFSPQKTQNLASEMNLKIASLGGILTQNGSPSVHNNISPVPAFSRPESPVPEKETIFLQFFHDSSLD